MENMTNCPKCGEKLLKLIEIDKITFVEYDSFIYQCPKCKEKFGDLVFKRCTDCHSKWLKEKGVLNDTIKITL